MARSWAATLKATRCCQNICKLLLGMCLLVVAGMSYTCGETTLGGRLAMGRPEMKPIPNR